MAVSIMQTPGGIMQMVLEGYSDYHLSKKVDYDVLVLEIQEALRREGFVIKREKPLWQR